jgi:hypothetical protein
MGVIKKIIKAGSNALKKSSKSNKVSNYENFYEPYAAKIKKQAAAKAKKSKNIGTAKTIAGTATGLAVGYAMGNKKKPVAKKTTPKK